MALCVTGCGRSGTNMVLEIFSCHPKFITTSLIEDKDFFRRRSDWDKIFSKTAYKYPSNVLTKCDTIYYTKNDLYITLRDNPHLYIVWCIRDPRDLFLSKIYRGYKVGADDGHPLGAIADIYSMFDIYQIVIKYCSSRAYLVKMEDIVLNTEVAIIDMCKWLKIEYNDDMPLFYKRMRDPNIKNEYDKIDISKVAEWKRIPELHDGFFIKNQFPLMESFNILWPIIRFFGYDSE